MNRWALKQFAQLNYQQMQYWISIMEAIVMNKRIYIIGGKTQARSLAESLNMKKYDVTVINKDENFCQRLAEAEGINVV